MSRYVELRAQSQVGDFIVGSNIVDLVHLTLVEDGVESICGVTSKEVSSCRSSITVQNDWLSAVSNKLNLGIISVIDQC